MNFICDGEGWTASKDRLGGKGEVHTGEVGRVEVAVLVDLGGTS